MPRYARITAPYLFYHIFNRGLEKSVIFRERADYLRFLHLLFRYSKKFDWIIYCYCLLPNHYHLLIKTKEDPLGKIMKSLQTAFSVYFNKKYNRVGPVFSGRYRSIICQKDEYLTQVSKYIHLNPVKAGLCKKPLNYPYSSYREYISGKSPLIDKNIIDKRSVKRIIGGKISKKSTQYYKSFVEEREDIIKYLPNIDIFGNKRFVTKFKRLD